jgi:hypothetical protein
VLSPHKGGGHDNTVAPQHGLKGGVNHPDLVNNAALAEMNLGELSIGVGKL